MDKNLKIGIIGLGLIGGSIFKALSALKCNVFGVSKSVQTIKKASRYDKNVSQSISIVKDCDIIFVCVHMNKTKEILKELDKVVSSKTIVADVCSLKKFVAEDKYYFKFIPTHPMAGTEFSGFDNSFESLFQDAKWVITPFKRTQKKDIKKITDIIKVLGAKPVLSTPEEHDKAVALISHMPLLLSQAIFKTARENKLAMKLASSGFRDVTRLALSNCEMASDMVSMNSENIQNSILQLYSSIGELISGDYLEQVKKIKNKRENMYLKGRNIL